MVCAPARARHTHAAAILVGAAACAVGIASVAIARHDPGGSFAGRSMLLAILELATGWSLITAGLACRRHRRRLFGSVLVAAGFVWFLPEWNNPGVGSPVVFTIGLVAFVACVPLVGHAALAYRRGALAGFAERATLAVSYLGALGLLGLLPAVVFAPNQAGCQACPRNLALVHGDESLYTAFNRWGIRFGVGWTLAVALLAAWRLATARNVFAVVAPVVVPACAYLLLVAWDFRHDLGGGILSNAPFDQRVWRYEAIALIAVAVGAAWGIVRGSRARSAVARVVVDLGRSPRPGGVRDALAHGLGDESLRLAYRRAVGDGYVDADGRETDVTPADGQAATPVVREGREVALLIHDRNLVDDPDLVEEVLAAAHIAVENERLQAEVRAQLEDLRRSRARIVLTGDAERRKLERDLHDGAQQRIVGLALGLQLLRARLNGTASRELRARLSDAEAQLRDALAALREVAHGIHPAVLSDEGLAAAVELLVENTEKGRVEVAQLPDESFPPAVEAAAYFVIAEAVKATRGHAVIEVSREDDKLLALVRLDDADFARIDPAAALIEIADRVGAIDGRFDVRQTGSTSILRAEIPCA